ncbi:MAG: hypothetical protein R2712_28390 [Vicinamibacterales bacterium]
MFLLGAPDRAGLVERLDHLHARLSEGAAFETLAAQQARDLGGRCRAAIVADSAKALEARILSARTHAAGDQPLKWRDRAGLHMGEGPHEGGVG